ncbi:MAG TPA: SCO family protein [Acidimicrobiales bacterium]|nr:SCO family protein [Acidimicrobiales bacterium]
MTRTAARLPAAFLAALVAAALLAACGDGRPAPPAPSVGLTQDRPVDPSVATAALTDEDGRPLALASLRGHVVVLASFLTSCQEVCPLTTGAFLTLRHDLAAAGLAHQVDLVEVTVDPERDDPARLAAYARLSGTDWPLLTAPAPTLAAFWRFFGAYYQKVPEGSPPGLDWQTGRPYTYDVDHSDLLVVLDASGHERFVTEGLPDVGGRLPDRLRRLLDSQGLANLAHPGQGSWTASDLRQAVAWVLGRPVPAAGPGG